MFNFKAKAVPTVANALKGFHAAIAELRAVKEHHDEKANKAEGAIIDAQRQAQEIIARATAAAAAATATYESLKEAAEAEAREAVKAIARVEQFLGL